MRGHFSMMIRISMLAAALVAALVIAPPTPARAAGLLSLEVCNKSGRDATVSVSFMEPGSDQWVTRGWFAVNPGACIVVGGTDNANFYMYAETLNSGDLSWGGSHNLCVQYPGPYTVYETGNGRTCNDNEELRGFMPMHADEAGTYTWTLNP
jgi:uncharacterized membrane protein